MISFSVLTKSEQITRCLTVRLYGFGEYFFSLPEVSAGSNFK